MKQLWNWEMKQTLTSVEGSTGVSGFLGLHHHSDGMCMSVDLVEVANDLNPPEGYLVQARDGTEDSSEIIGTFLNRTVVRERNPSVPLNFKILRCKQSINVNGIGELLDVRNII